MSYNERVNLAVYCSKIRVYCCGQIRKTKQSLWSRRFLPQCVRHVRASYFYELGTGVDINFYHTPQQQQQKQNKTKQSKAKQSKANRDFGLSIAQQPWPRRVAHPSYSGACDYGGAGARLIRSRSAHCTHAHAQRRWPTMRLPCRVAPAMVPDGLSPLGGLSPFLSTGLQAVVTQ